jgi:hypothetical protein
MPHFFANVCLCGRNDALGYKYTVKLDVVHAASLRALQTEIAAWVTHHSGGVQYARFTPDGAPDADSLRLQHESASGRVQLFTARLWRAMPVNALAPVASVNA